ncbi:MAG: GtrA family protein [bacterium]
MDPSCHWQSSQKFKDATMSGGAVDRREFARFVVTGLLATLGNVSAVAVTRQFSSFEIALFAGIGAGILISFLTTKVFAFRSRGWRKSAGESARFLGVYLASVTIYWFVARAIGHIAVSQGITLSVAELSGVLVGAGVMMIASYLGHRFITYRTYRNHT